MTSAVTNAVTDVVAGDPRSVLLSAPRNTVGVSASAAASNAKDDASVSVVKLGGSLLEDAAACDRALEAIASAWTSGERILLVHGGGKEIDKTLAREGIPRRIQGGLRVTDADTLSVVVSVLAGGVNKSLVAKLRARGVLAAGFSGADGETLWAEYHSPVEGTDLGFVGQVVRCRPELVRGVLSTGFLPVIASLAMGRNGVLLNVNADTAAAALAVAFSATRLVYLTDVEGVRDGTGHIVETLGAAKARALLASPAVQGGMRPKLAACLFAIQSGVPEVLIAGPSRHEAVLFDGQGGTRLVAA